MPLSLHFHLAEKFIFWDVFNYETKLIGCYLSLIIFKPWGKIYEKIELVQKEWCRILVHAPFEQMHGSNLTRQSLSYIFPFIENKT